MWLPKPMLEDSYPSFSFSVKSGFSVISCLDRHFVQSGRTDPCFTEIFLDMTQQNSSSPNTLNVPLWITRTVTICGNAERIPSRLRALKGLRLSHKRHFLIWHPQETKYRDHKCHHILITSSFQRPDKGMMVMGGLNFTRGRFQWCRFF